ncbi:2-hydroxymuconate tautomerase [Devosia lacusdianchii]|jgi:4-oxalocrotonate tautomerase|uniref:2-hydroxymuconate tautomerase n=1 Tax=Devosia lacusdianchii TaxID=2917991 RepID=UPI001F0546AB|nr:2-hydroxymuconate tautomerase [Devosia sp. JXJ CY 41]
MPYVKIDMLEGRTPDQKAALARAITDAFVEHAAAKRESVWVVFDDVARKDWAIAGELLEKPAK